MGVAFFSIMRPTSLNILGILLRAMGPANSQLCHKQAPTQNIEIGIGISHAKICTLDLKWVYGGACLYV